MEQADFGQILLLSDRPPPVFHSAIIWKQIEPLGSRADYSRFMLHSLADHISSSHALCVQWDGFVVNGAAWTPEFLNYDYLGAVWPHFHDEHNVGNGGFSLRSRRLLDECRMLPSFDDRAEDVVISRLCRSQLEERGISFAPEAIANRFSYERTRSNGCEFGFHGAFNLVRYLRRDQAVRLFRSLEPEMLAKNERWELLRWAVLRGRLGLAKAMFDRLV